MGFISKLVKMGLLRKILGSIFGRRGGRTGRTNRKNRRPPRV